MAPGFRPRWARIERGLYVVAGVMVVLFTVGTLSDSQILVRAAFIGAGAVVFAVSFVKHGGTLLGFLGDWSHWLGLKSAQLERWLEQDLDRG